MENLEPMEGSPFKHSDPELVAEQESQIRNDFLYEWF